MKQLVRALPSPSSSYCCLITACVAGCCPEAAACRYYSGGLSWFTIITRDKFHKTTQLWCSVGIILQTKASLMLLF